MDAALLTRTRRALALTLTLLLALGALPALADAGGEDGALDGDTDEADPTDDEAGDETEEAGDLFLTVRPRVVAPGRSVLVQAGYGAPWPGGGNGQPEDADGDDALEDGGDEDGDEDGDDALEAQAGPAASERMAGPPAGVPGRPLAVTFTIDFGDGSGEQPMRPTRQDPRGGSGAALAQHTYAEAGPYTLTVTAWPVDGGPAVTEKLDIEVGTGSARLEGDDRKGTAAEVSMEGFPEDGSAEAVLIARADDFADALASAPLAIEAQGPVLLTDTAELCETVLAEIARALGDEGTVYVLGGEAAISGTVVDTLVEAGYDVERVDGEDRVATALAVAEFLVASGVAIDEVVLAASHDFADALAGGAYAASVAAPVLLTDGDELDERVAAFLAEAAERAPDLEVLAVGGETALSAAVVDAVAEVGVAVERIAGADRYATSVALAQARYHDPATLVFATGQTFADAVAAAAFAGTLGAPVLLVDDPLSDALVAYLEGLDSVEVAYLIGGSAAIPDDLEGELEARLGFDLTDDPTGDVD